MSGRRCPYCLVEHSLRGKYCCPEHAKRSAGQLASNSRARNKVRRLLLAQAQERHRWDRAWRQIALGLDDGSLLGAIFNPEHRAKRRKRLRTGATTLNQVHLPPGTVLGGSDSVGAA